MSDSNEEKTATSEPDDTAWPKLGVRPLVLLALFGAVVFAFLLDLAVGSVRIPFDQILAILTGGPVEKEAWEKIVMLYRLPRALTAMLSGAALAAAGLQMQTLFRNPLAGPFVLGIHAGASLGVALVVLVVGSVTGSVLFSGLDLFGSIGTVAAASVGSALVFVLIVAVSRRVESNMTLLILGLMFGYATSALVSILLHFSAAEQVQVYVSWTFGSFGGVTWSQMKALAPTVGIGLVLAHLSVKPMNAMLLGDAYARSLGVAIGRARVVVIASSSLLAGTVTAFCGPIAFLGVAVPHLCRALFGTADHRVLVPAVTLMGALLALGSDLIAQFPGSETVLPLNAVTSLIGAPVVIWVILGRVNLKSNFAE